MNYYIGWDVGAWHCSEKGSASKDALAVLDERNHLIGTWEGNLSEVVLELGAVSIGARPLAFIHRVFDKCKIKMEVNQDSDVFFVAIDTPLGWPKHFIQLLGSWSRGESSENKKDLTVNLEDGKIGNPFLHRKTETAIGQCLSAVQDQIGSQSTKAIYLLNTLQVRGVSTGVWNVSSPETTFIETYPAPCMRSFAFIDALKKVSGNKPIDSEDIFDAIVCAFLVSQYSLGPESKQINFPSEDIDQEEGWIFTPKNCMSSSFGVSYGRLIGSQSPLKPICDLLSQIQVGMVMKSLPRSSRQRASKSTSPADSASSELLVSWLKQSASNDDALRSFTPEDMKALYKLLNPKAKTKQYPSDEDFQKIAKLVEGKLTP